WWGMNFWRSTDGGSTYARVSHMPFSPFSLAIAPDGTIYCGGERRGEVYSSSDKGDHWTHLDPNQLIKTGNLFAIEINKAGEVLMGGNDLQGIAGQRSCAGPYRYKGNHEWVESNAGLPAAAGKITCMSKDPNGDLLLGLSKGEKIYISRDDGHTWVPYAT